MLDCLQQRASGLSRVEKTEGPLLMAVWRGVYLAPYTIKWPKNHRISDQVSSKIKARKPLIAFLQFHKSLHNCQHMSLGLAAAGRCWSPINRDNRLIKCICGHYLCTENWAARSGALLLKIQFTHSFSFKSVSGLKNCGESFEDPELIRPPAHADRINISGWAQLNLWQNSIWLLYDVEVEGMRRFSGSSPSAQVVPQISMTYLTGSHDKISQLFLCLQKLLPLPIRKSLLSIRCLHRQLALVVVPTTIL